MTERLIRAGNVAAIWIVICNICLVFANLGGFDAGKIFLIVTAAYFAGYAVQWVTAKLVRFERVADSESYESDEKFFKPVAAVPGFVLTAVIFIAGIPIVDDYMVKYAQNTAGFYYESDGAVTPVLVAFMTAAVFVAGLVVWFIPSGRLMSTKGAIIGTAVMFASSIFSGFSSLTCVYLVCFTVIAMLTANQNVISKKYRGTVVTFVTNKTRGLNMSIVGAMIGIAAILTFVCASVISAFVMAVIFPILVFIFRNTGASEDEYMLDDGADVGDEVGELLADKTGAGSESVLTILTAVAIAMLLVGLIFFIFRRKAGFVSLVARIKEFIASIFDFWFGLFTGKIAKGQEIVEVNYTDTERKVQNAVINPYVKAGRRVATYKEFSAKLKTFETSHERLMFAYVTMVGVLRRDRTYISEADTPHEICEKLRDNTSYSDIDGMTEAFEAVAYASAGAENDTANENAVRVICIILQANMV